MGGNFAMSSGDDRGAMYALHDSRLPECTTLGELRAPESGRLVPQSGCEKQPGSARIGRFAGPRRITFKIQLERSTAGPSSAAKAGARPHTRAPSSIR